MTDTISSKVRALADKYLQQLDDHTQALENLAVKAQALKRGDSVSWGSSGGTARGKITKIITDGTQQVPDSSFKITGTPEDPAALVKVYRLDADGKYKPTDTVVGHKVSALTKISALD